MVSLKIVRNGALGLNHVPKRYRVLAMLGMIFVTIFILVLPTYLVFKKETNVNRKNMAVLNIDKNDTDPTSGNLVNKDQLNVFLKVGSIDLSTLRMQVFVNFAPTGIFLLKGQAIHPGALNVPASTTPGALNPTLISIQFGDEANRTAGTGDNIGPLTLMLPLTNGDVTDYPFDAFQSEITLSVLYTGFSSLIPPVGVVADGTVQNFNIRPSIANEQANSAPFINISFDITRSSTTQGFAVFLVILMWCLSLAALGVAIDIIIRKASVPAPLLAMLTALIFALPALRSAAPGAPQIGAVIDIIGFFWNMVFAGTAALIMISWFIVHNQMDLESQQIVIEDDEDKGLEGNDVGESSQKNTKKSHGKQLSFELYEHSDVETLGI